MSDLFDDRYGDWTRDAAGNPVIWNKPPYQGPGGRGSLLLPGEPQHLMDVSSLHHKRIREYYLLVERDSKILQAEK